MSPDVYAVTDALLAELPDGVGVVRAAKDAEELGCITSGHVHERGVVFVNEFLVPADHPTEIEDIIVRKGADFLDVGSR